MQTVAYNRRSSAVSPNLPDFSADDLADVDFKWLYRIGVRHLLFDLDQTLRRAYAKELDPAVSELIRGLQTKERFKNIVIVSNNQRRLTRFSAPLGLRTFQPFRQGVRWVRKPNQRFFARVVSQLGVQPAETAIIGDKLRSDIAGGNRAGFVTVLVKPRGPDYWFDWLLLYRLRERLRYHRALHLYQKKH